MSLSDLDTSATAAEVERVLAALAKAVRDNGEDAALEAAALRLLRAAREDFDLYGQHAGHCAANPQPDGPSGPCICGLDAARKKWELPS